MSWPAVARPREDRDFLTITERAIATMKAKDGDLICQSRRDRF
jgi:hypothetical protein